MNNLLYYLRYEETFSEKISQMIQENPGLIVKGVVAVCVLPTIIGYAPYILLGYEIYNYWDTIQRFINLDIDSLL